MNSEPEYDPNLERILDQAGASAQPTHTGWSRMSERLNRLSQQRHSRRWRLALPVGIAAAAAVVWFTLLGGTPDIVIAADEPIRVERQDVEVTILSVADTSGETLYMPLLQRISSQIPVADPTQAITQMLVWRDLGAGRWLPQHPQPKQRTGQALVKDHRLILNLKVGDNVVKFADVAASIDPTSVRFFSTTDPDGTVVVEQNFEYDLASANTLMQRFIDLEIVCIAKDGAELSGYLASIDDSQIVLSSDPAKKPISTQTISRETLQSVRLPSMPSGLLIKPTLVWKLRAKTAGKHDTTVSYLCGKMDWNADYVAIVDPGKNGEPDRVNLNAWVSINNLSGATFDEAGLKLIAGDVNRVRDPWASIPPQIENSDEPISVRETVENVEAPVIAPKKFIEKSFFEYHLYTLSAPTTMRDAQIKQLGLFQRDGVLADRRYLVKVSQFQTQKWPTYIELMMKNNKENQLGMPMPKGRITLLQRDVDGEHAIIGRAETDHVSKDEELHFIYGQAFEVVSETKAVRTEMIGGRHTRQHAEARVRNHKSTPIHVRVEVFLGVNWKVTKESMAHVKHDFETIHYDFDLAPDTERVIEYTVDYRW